MTMRAIYKKCRNCGKQFSYDPSAGDPGMICRFCGKPANVRFSGEKIKAEDVSAVRELLDDFSTGNK